MSDIEIPLEGGNVNAEVVRVSNTVRRQMSAASPTAHKLLRHLAAKGFANSPRFLGIDKQGREMLSFIEGDTDFPEDIWTESAALIATAKMLREFHDATADFSADNPIWAQEYRDPSQHEVICHNDFAPYNFIFADGVPKAVIDLIWLAPDRDCAMLHMLPIGWCRYPLIPTICQDMHLPIWQPVIRG